MDEKKLLEETIRDLKAEVYDNMKANDKLQSHMQEVLRGIALASGMDLDNELTLKDILDRVKFLRDSVEEAAEAT